MSNYNKKSFDERLKAEMRLKWSRDIDMTNLISGALKETHPRIYKRYKDRIGEMERSLGAEINYYKDYTDNHRYNNLRTRLIEQRKRQEDREYIDTI